MHSHCLKIKIHVGEWRALVYMKPRPKNPSFINIDLDFANFQRIVLVKIIQPI